MESFSDPRLLELFLLGIPVGVFAILFGASQFLSLPLFQLLFPGLTVGGIVGNIKVGSALRNAIALLPLRKEIRAWDHLPLLGALCIGAVIGSLSIASLPQFFLLPILLCAIVATESAPYLSGRIPQSVFLLLSIIAGIFGGILGAGLSVIILALLRVQHSDDSKIYSIRVQGVFIEWVTTIASLAGFFVRNQLVFSIWISWALGSMIGGYIGGFLLKRTGKLSPRSQKILLRLVYVIALGVAGYRAFA